MNVDQFDGSVRKACGSERVRRFHIGYDFRPYGLLLCCFNRSTVRLEQVEK
jgi:hypothetical protein